MGESNARSKDEHVKELIDYAEKQREWTPSIEYVDYLCDTKVGGLFVVSVKGYRIALPYVVLEGAETFWNRVVKTVIEFQKKKENKHGEV